MQNWVVVEEAYLDYLRAAEPRIPFSDYGTDKLKPFFGTLFEVGDLVYVTQVSHPKPRHAKMKNSLDFHKIYVPGETAAINGLGLEAKAEKLYRLKAEHPENWIAQRCLDFHQLEECAKQYPAT